jgi:hypothetical protein
LTRVETNVTVTHSDVVHQSEGLTVASSPDAFSLWTLAKCAWCHILTAGSHCRMRSAFELVRDRFDASFFPRMPLEESHDLDGEA